MESYLEAAAWRGYRRDDFPAESWAWDGDCIRCSRPRSGEST